MHTRRCRRRPPCDTYTASWHSTGRRHRPCSHNPRGPSVWSWWCGNRPSSPLDGRESPSPGVRSPPPPSDRQPSARPSAEGLLHQLLHTHGSSVMRRALRELRAGCGRATRHVYIQLCTNGSGKRDTRHSTRQDTWQERRGAVRRARTAEHRATALVETSSLLLPLLALEAAEATETSTRPPHDPTSFSTPTVFSHPARTAHRTGPRTPDHSSRSMYS